MRATAVRAIAVLDIDQQDSSIFLARSLMCQSDRDVINAHLGAMGSLGAAHDEIELSARSQLSSEYPENRSMACHVLSQMNHLKPETLKKLEGLLRDPIARVRDSALVAYVYTVGNPLSVISAVDPWLKSSDYHDRLLAVTLLLHHKGTDAIDDLLEEIAEREFDEFIRSRITQAKDL